MFCLFVLSPQLHFKLFKGRDLTKHISMPILPGGPPGRPSTGHQGVPTPFSSRVPSFWYPPPAIPKGSALWNAESARGRIPAAGPHPLHPKAGHAPPTLPPAAVVQNCWLPHSLTSPPLPSQRGNTTKRGWAVASGQWDLGGESGPGQEGRVGADREWAKSDLRQNHSPASSSLG